LHVPLAADHTRAMRSATGRGGMIGLASALILVGAAMLPGVLVAGSIDVTDPLLFVGLPLLLLGAALGALVGQPW